MEKRFVALWFPHLLTDWHTRKQPELKAVPFVLRVQSGNRSLVTAACPRAQRAGVRAGMLLADARALQPELHILDDKPALGTQLLDRIAEWCIRFTPVAASNLPDGILLDATGCAHLWGGEERYLQEITRRLLDRSYTVRAAMAGTIGAAWAMARYGKGAPIALPAQQRACLLPLPVPALRLEEALTQRLYKLGLRYVKDLDALPRAALRRRFGTQLLQRMRQAMGEEEEFLQPFYPLEPYSERLPCVEPIVTRTGIEIALKQLLEKLCARLQREGNGLRKAVFRGYRVDGQTQGIEIGTSRPSNRVEHLFHLFSLKIDTIEPALGIELFLIEAPVVEEAAAVQDAFWKTGGGLQHPQLAELIDRLRGKLAGASVQRFLPAEHYWPERAFEAAPSLAQEARSEWKLDRPRPLHLLDPPERIEVTAPVPDYPPMNFRYRGKLHRIVRADGPERIEPEWWLRTGDHRDYYSVEDDEGQRYWLYRLGHYTADRTERWFMHGMFV
ncbi:MAG: DNA polymerase Y family protein [Chitinophagaceae bacterium]|nr:MAG: DNA polymerase Y family protein [Chitinophagaceae bacterium]